MTEGDWAALLENVARVDLSDDRLAGVEVWRGELGANRPRVAEPLDRLAARALDSEEQRRAAAFARAEDRAEYVTAHLVLRGLLGRRLDRAPAELRFRRAACPACGGPHGRPELTGADRSLHFSLSHGAGIVLVALAARPVGVDVEAWPTPETVTAVAPTLPAAARAELAQAGDGDRAAVFARAWARLEAHLKAVGTGIAVDLAAVDLARAEASGWVIEDLVLGRGLAGAAALGPA